MSEYKVYKHPVQGYEAVKLGFSWPALLFGGIWALVKKMWLVGVVLIVAQVLTVSIAAAYDSTTAGSNIDGAALMLYGIFYILFSYSPSIIAGIFGNRCIIIGIIIGDRPRFPARLNALMEQGRGSGCHGERESNWPALRST